MLYVPCGPDWHAKWHALPGWCRVLPSAGVSHGMSTLLKIGQRVRVVFPLTPQGRALVCSRHLLDGEELAGQIGEVMSVHRGDGHTVGVGFMGIWHEGSPWSDYFRPEELMPA